MDSGMRRKTPKICASDADPQAWLRSGTISQAIWTQVLHQLQHETSDSQNHILCLGKVGDEGQLGKVLILEIAPVVAILLGIHLERPGL